MVMTRAQFARDLQDGINSHFGMSYDTWPTEYTKFCTKKTENKRAYVENILRVGLGEAVEKPEGGMITFDAGAEGWVSRIDFYTISTAIAFTEEAIDDNLYGDISEIYGKEMGKAMQHAKEVRGSNLLNNATNSSYTGGDLKSLLATDHPLWGGGAYSNTFDTPADVSEEAFEDACVQVQGYVNDRGRPIIVKVRQAIVPRQQEFTMERILKATKRVGTNLNDPNVLKDGGYIPDGYMVSHFLIDPDSWFLQTDADQGLEFWQRKGLVKKMETDFRTGNLMWKVQERIGFGWTDPRAIIGSSGSPV